jgi:hypothetical protein
LRVLRNVKTCQKFSGETEEGGGIMKNEMSSMLMDEKICFIRLPPDTPHNFWQVITTISSSAWRKFVVYLEGTLLYPSISLLQIGKDIMPTLQG